MINEYNVYLDCNMREKLLDYDINNSEQSYDNLMWYICNSEKEILYNILLGLDINTLLKLGFDKNDCELLFNTDQFYVEFTNNENYYIEKIN